MVINIVDTPGHADFGGEVERALMMVDGVVLLVDASEGPLPQTRFVLRKALQANLPVVLVVNKTDRPDSRIDEVVDETYALFLDLDADDHQIEFPIVYCASRAGRASLNKPANGEMPDHENLDPLFDTLLEAIPAPTYEPGAPLQAQVTNIDASPFLGRIGMCRIIEGEMKKGQQVAWMKADGTVARTKITELLITEALDRVPVETAYAGDLIAVAGMAEITIGETLADPENPVALPPITVDEPAISMTVGINTSPLAGKDGGKKLTARQVKNRLDAELDRQRLDPRAQHRASRHLGGAGPWRAGAGHPRRDDAPGELRADRRQAAGRHPRGRRQDPGAVRAPDHRRSRGVPRRRHPAARRPQGPHGADEQPRHRLGPAGVPRAVARPDRFPHRLPHRHPRHRHRVDHLRRLRPVGRRRCAAARPVRWSPTAPARPPPSP